ncbi:MAG TPA: hypothetical protein VN706_05720 [Gemmatimonadaceae bacterium]|nr:hypothetical protein [Gemmatimonadaceae bacterium]
MKRTWIGACVLLAACRLSHGTTAPSAPPANDGGHWANVGHACSADSPALSLATDKVRPYHRGLPDDRWADISRTTPGGFAGLVPAQNTNVYRVSWYSYWLVDTTQRAAAEPLLRAAGIPVDSLSTVRKARWSWAQLFDWMGYLQANVTGATMNDIDEATNRLHFGTADAEHERHMEQQLARLGVPCNLVWLSRFSGVTLLESSPSRPHKP